MKTYLVMVSEPEDIDSVVALIEEAGIKVKNILAEIRIIIVNCTKAQSEIVGDIPQVVALREEGSVSAI